MSAPKPKCFCAPQIENCPKCTKPNWSAMRPSNGDAEKDRLLRASIMSRKLATAAVLVLQVIVWTAGKPTPEEAAKTLANSPGLSNRTGLEGHVTLTPRAPVSVTPAPRVDRPASESAQGRANRLGIPGGWTPLEWAILHAGR